MEKDIVANVEVLTTQASDTDSAAAATGAPPTVQTPLEDATLAASSGANVGQKSMGQRENDEMEKMSVLSLYPSAEADAPRPHAAPVLHAWQGADRQGNVGKKNSRKRRNRKENKIVYFPWSLTLQTQASSAAPVLGQTCVTGALSVADTGMDVGHETRQQRRNGEKEKASVLTQPWKAPASALLPEASTVQPSLEGASLADSGETMVEQKSRHKGIDKNRKILARPWPLTVQAWVSFKGRTQVQKAFAGASQFANDDVNGEPRSRGQKSEIHKTSVVTSYQSAQAGTPRSAVVLGQASLEEAPLTNSGGNLEKKSRQKKRNIRNKSVLAHPWPLTVQAWASFTARDPVPSKSSAASMGVNVGQKIWPQRENSEEKTKSILPQPVGGQAGIPFSATAPGQAPLEESPSLEDVHSNLS